MSKSLPIKVHLYEVVTEGTVKITDIIIALKAKDQESRIQHIAGYRTKMEDLESPESGVWIANFCKQRNIGPGKSSRELSTVSFELNDDEYFGEMTAILLTEDRKHVLVQYNHYGVRASSIAQYLTGFATTEGGIIFHPILQREVSAKFRLADKVGSIEATFNLTADIDAYTDTAKSIMKAINPWHYLQQALDTIGESATKISCKISGRGGKFGGISKDIGTGLIDDLLVLNKENIVTSAKAKVRYPDGTHELLDLLNAKEEEVFRIEIPDGKRMIDFEDSKKFLKEAYLHWKNKKMIKK